MVILSTFQFGSVLSLIHHALYFQFPGEVVNYWIQHSLIFFVIPPYLIYIWGALATACEETAVDASLVMSSLAWL